MRFALFCCIALLVVGSVTAPAYTLNDSEWSPSDFPIEYWIDTQGSSSMPEDTEVQVIRDAFQRWSDLPSSTFSATYMGRKTCTVAEDGENHILWGDLGDYVFAPLARTHIHAQGQKIIDADIIFNENAVYQWTEQALWPTALHEIGHFLGLGHTTNIYAIMHPTASSSRTDLGSDDIEGITFLYPAADLSDLAPARMLYPLYASTRSVGPMAAEIQNAGFPEAATIEVILYVSDSEIWHGTEISLGRTNAFVEGEGPFQVTFPRVSFGKPEGLWYLHLAVDTQRQVFEADEKNNVGTFPLPVVPFEANGDQDLSGRVDYADAFLFSRHYEETKYSVVEPYRFDFGQKYTIGREDLFQFLGRWHGVTLPE